MENENKSDGNAAERITVLGKGCNRCKKLEANVHEALKDMGKDMPVGHITDIKEISAYNVMTMPALVIDGKVVLAGQVPEPEELRSLLERYIL
jgi:small redox-active disulfide protein 2